MKYELKYLNTISDVNIAFRDCWYPSVDQFVCVLFGMEWFSLKDGLGGCIFWAYSAFFFLFFLLFPVFYDLQQQVGSRVYDRPTIVGAEKTLGVCVCAQYPLLFNLPRCSSVIELVNMDWHFCGCHRENRRRQRLTDVFMQFGWPLSPVDGHCYQLQPYGPMGSIISAAIIFRPKSSTIST